MEAIEVRTATGGEAAQSGPFHTRIVARHHRSIADEPDDLGGRDLGATPMEMALGALGACTGITLEMYAKRKGWPLEAVETEITAEEGADRKRTVTTVIHLKGPLSEEQKTRLLQIANACPVHKLMKGEAALETRLAASPAPSNPA